MDFSRATASAICKSSSLLALTAIVCLPSNGRTGFGLPLDLLELGLHAGRSQRLLLSACAGPRKRPGPRRGAPPRPLPPASLSSVRSFAGAQQLADERLGEHQPAFVEIGERQRTAFSSSARASMRSSASVAPRRLALDASIKPRKRLRPLPRDGSVRSRASWPMARRKSDTRTSGRSMPGEEISSR